MGLMGVYFYMTKWKYMHCQLCFQAFGLCLSQLLASVQYLLCSAEFAAVLLWMLGPWGHPHPVVYLISACIVLPNLTARFLLQGLFQQAATLALGRPVGVLAPRGVTVVAAPGPLGHLASIWDVSVNLILSYLFIYLGYLDRLAQFGFKKQV